MLENTMLDYIRIALYAMLAAVALFLYQAWQKEHPPTPPITVANSQQLSAPTADGRYIPQAKTQAQAQTAQEAAAGSTSAPAVLPTDSTGKVIYVTTDRFKAVIDTKGGDLIETKLLDYPVSLGSKQPIELLNNDPQTRYVAESGLQSTLGPDTQQGVGVYHSDQDQYTMQPDQNNLVVKLNWEKDGVNVTKNYTFTRGSYVIGVNYEIDNQSPKPWQGQLYTQLLRTDTPPPNHGGLVNLTTYFGAAISSPEKHFNKISFKDMIAQPLDQTIQGGWAAMIQHYFISAWIPDPAVKADYYTKVSDKGTYTLGMMNPAIVAAPGGKAEVSAKLYTGPAISDQLEAAAPSLKLTIDYGIFWFISGLIFWLMQKIYDVVGNWGWSIVIVTIIIKLLFYHLSAKSYRSMSGLKKLQPRIELLKERFGDDRQKLTQATLELYKQEKVNPMSGCLPILIQIPVFIALYWVLVESVELRQAPFMLWIRDLSQPDPYYVLPVLMGLSMFLQQRLNPPPPDPTQAKVMMLMPVIFTVMFANFPSGLMLYWFVNNSLSFLQQWYIMHSMEKETKK